MTANNFLELAQKSFRITLGATASLIETLQDPQRRSENFSRLKTEFDQLAEEWEVKGVSTEQEARSFVDNWLNQRSPERPVSSDAASYTPPPASPTSSATSAPANIQQDLQDLTTQLAEIRAELEKLRE